MAKEEGVKTVVFGGSKDVQQQYCGIVGGQSTDFATIDTSIKACMPEIANNFIMLRLCLMIEYPPQESYTRPT